MIPHPANEMARRITELEARAGSAVTVWDPTQSVSGMWEALGDGWDKPIIEASPSLFADKLQMRLDGR